MCAANRWLDEARAVALASARERKQRVARVNARRIDRRVIAWSRSRIEVTGD
jgi:hypothetical protein